MEFSHKYKKMPDDWETAVLLDVIPCNLEESFVKELDKWGTQS